MNRTAQAWLSRSLVVTTAASLISCAHDSSTGPNRSALLAQLVGVNKQAIDLGTCQNLQAPAGSKLAYHVFATGVQIYSWNGTSWSFVGPQAVLTADANGNGAVGIHYAGPTWESNSGSKVVGAVVERCSPNPNAIPWLLLTAASAEGPGVFDRVTSIQRVNTVAGNAPATPGNVVGAEARVPYTAEYFFYRAK